MKSNDLFTDGIPVYMQLYEKLKDQIIEGVYAFGSKIPSKRVLADRYGLSLITVEHTLSLLCDEGYIEPKERSGYFVVFRAGEIFVGHTSETKIIQRTQNAISEFPFSVYARTMRRVISEYGEEVMESVPNTGADVLKKAISDYLARSRGMRVAPERIVIGSGSEYLYGLVVQLFGRNKSYAIEKPGYEKIEMVYKANGARLELLPLGSDGIMSEALAGSNADILHITPYRSYPTGISTDASKRREYIRWANAKSAYIVEDDYESEFTTSTKPEETVFSLSTNDNVLYLNSFSKTIAPSIRISYLILPLHLVSVFEEKLGFYKCTVPSFDQYVLAEFINGGEFERHLNRVRRHLRNRKQVEIYRI